MPEWLGSTANPLSPARGVDIGGAADAAAFISDVSGNDLHLGSDGLLYYGTDPTLVVSPVLLQFRLNPDVTSSRPFQVFLNPAVEAVTVTLTPSAGWVTVSPTTGATPLSATVTVSTAGLTEGLYTTTIIVSAAGYADVVMAVALEVTLEVPTTPGNPIVLCQTDPAINQNFLQVGGYGEPAFIGNYQSLGTGVGLGDGSFTITIPAGSYLADTYVGYCIKWGKEPYTHIDHWDSTVDPENFFSDSVSTVTGGPVVATSDGLTPAGYLTGFTYWVESPDTAVYPNYDGYIDFASIASLGVFNGTNICGPDPQYAPNGTVIGPGLGNFHSMVLLVGAVDLTVVADIVITVTRHGQARTSLAPVVLETQEQRRNRLVSYFLTDLFFKTSPSRERLYAYAETIGETPAVTEALIKSKFPFLRDGVV